MAFRWRSNDGPTLNAGLVALLVIRESKPVFLRKHIFVIFRGGGGVSTAPVPSQDPRMGSMGEKVMTPVTRQDGRALHGDIF